MATSAQQLTQSALCLLSRRVELYYDVVQPRDGTFTPELTLAEAERLCLSRLPIAYGKVHDADFTKTAPLERWIEETIDPEYTGPVCIDYEAPHWKTVWQTPLSTREAREHTAEVYHRVYTFAKTLRPRARWGFYGLPVKKYYPVNTDAFDRWVGLIEDSMSLVVNHTNVCFPALYDRRPDVIDGDHEVIRRYLAITRARTRLPLYPFVNPRWGGDTRVTIPEEDFLDQLTAALEQPAVKGLVFWDGYNRDPAAAWPDIDALHAERLRQLNQLARKAPVLRLLAGARRIAQLRGELP